MLLLLLLLQRKNILALSKLGKREVSFLLLCPTLQLWATLTHAYTHYAVVLAYIGR